MDYQIIIPTGYMGSGSSAITNLLSEVQGYDINNDTFEYILLHCPDGLFDLEDKLLRGNNVLRSDEAIHRFLKCMRDLYSKSNYWASGYKEKISENFLEYCKEFIEHLIDVKITESYWYFQQNPSGFRMSALNYLRRILGKLSRGNIKIKRPVSYNEVFMSFPTEEYFYDCSKELLNRLFIALGLNDHSIVLDQFLLPHNLFRLNKYFNENVKVVVVDRDPRDVFLLNKYVWAPQTVAVPYPLDVYDFCIMYKKMRESENRIQDKKIERIHFEDLIYKYDQTLNLVFDFLKIDKVSHIRKKQYLNPDISIKNTQLFLLDEDKKEEAKVIESVLSEYLYDFPKENIKREKLSTLF